MGAVEGETCPHIVVKVPQLPVSGGMAQFALRAESSCMHIFLCVARGALDRGIFESYGLVTFLAVDQLVLAAQLEPGGVMVEGGFLPGLFAMARLAPFTFLPLMAIILLMAGHTGGRRLV